MTKKVTDIARAHAKKPRIVRTDAVLAEIFDRVANGESLNKICTEPGMPTRKSFYEWLKEDDSILRRYEFAMLMRADTYAEETIEIADDRTHDIRIMDDGREIVDYDAIQRSKLRVDARKWYASKLAPKKYGDRILNEHQGGDPDRPLHTNITVSFVAPNPPK